MVFNLKLEKWYSISYTNLICSESLADILIAPKKYSLVYWKTTYFLVKSHVTAYS